MLPPDTPVGIAVFRFERGEMKLDLFWYEGGFVWFHGRERFSRPLATVEAAVQFLKDISEIYNCTLDLGPAPLHLVTSKNSTVV